MRGNYQVKKLCVVIAVEECCCNGQNQAVGALPSLFAAAEQHRYTPESSLEFSPKTDSIACFKEQ
jgi:hypothetical protein